MKIITNVLFVIAILIFFLALTSSFTIILFIIFHNIIFDTAHVNFLDMLIKSSFSLIGSTLSGFVAILIFFLGDRKQRREKAEKEKKHLEKILDEFNMNIQVLKTMLGTFEDYTTDEIADFLFIEDNKIKGYMQIFSVRLDFTFYGKSRDEINEQEYLNHINKLRKMHAIGKYLDTLVTKITNKENAKGLLDLIKKESMELTKQTD